MTISIKAKCVNAIQITLCFDLVFLGNTRKATNGK